MGTAGYLWMQWSHANAKDPGQEPTRGRAQRCPTCLWVCGDAEVAQGLIACGQYGSLLQCGQYEGIDEGMYTSEDTACSLELVVAHGHGLECCFG